MKYGTIYNQSFGIKSKTCLSKGGEPLTEYQSESAAQDGARSVNVNADSEMVPYKCQKCGKWHLSPVDRVTPNTIGCRCKDSRGKPKALYETKEAAEQRAKIIAAERGKRLFVYRCPNHRGWHLSHTKYR